MLRVDHMLTELGHLRGGSYDRLAGEGDTLLWGLQGVGEKGLGAWSELGMHPKRGFLGSCSYFRNSG